MELARPQIDAYIYTSISIHWTTNRLRFAMITSWMRMKICFGIPYLLLHVVHLTTKVSSIVLLGWLPVHTQLNFVATTWSCWFACCCREKPSYSPSICFGAQPPSPLTLPPRHLIMQKHKQPEVSIHIQSGRFCSFLNLFMGTSLSGVCHCRT